MLGFTQEQRKQKFRHDFALWLISFLIVPIFIVYLFVVANDVFVVMLPVIGLLLVITVGENLLFAMVVFFDWFPNSYYEDLTECKKCGKKAVKTVCERMCFACGDRIDCLPKEDIQHVPPTSPPESSGC